MRRQAKYAYTLGQRRVETHYFTTADTFSSDEEESETAPRDTGNPEILGNKIQGGQPEDPKKERPEGTSSQILCMMESQESGYQLNHGTDKRSAPENKDPNQESQTTYKGNNRNTPKNGSGVAT